MQQKEIFIVISVILFILFGSSAALAITVFPLNEECDPIITIEDESIEPSPLFQSESPILRANITGNNLSNVWFESNFNGSFVNYTNVHHIFNTYRFTIPSSSLSIDELVSWRFYATNKCD